MSSNHFSRSHLKGRILVSRTRKDITPITIKSQKSALNNAAKLNEKGVNAPEPSL
jgi:hypothetical protein